MIKKCLICNKQFEMYRITQRFCSKSCGNKNHYQENINKYKEAAKRSQPKQAEKRKEANKHKWFAVCEFCNKDYKKKSQVQKYCSIVCQKETLNLKYNENDFNSTWRKNTYARRKEDPIKYKKFIKNGTKYQIEKRKENPLYAIICRLRTRTGQIFRVNGWEKKEKTLNFLGCTPKELKIHLENQFIDNMSWDNKELWHIDHIKPLSLANTEEELYTLCHYTNLQPLWAEDNLKKSNKY